MEILELNVKGVAVDVLSEDWQIGEIIQKNPVSLEKISKRKGGFTIYMSTPYEKIEWYFSSGLTKIEIFSSNEDKIIRIEHEDGHYWVDVKYTKEIMEFLREFVEE